MREKNQGFTLAELLVVVAIIGILVAISIPIFTAQRRKAIIAVNKANIRSAKAAAAAKLYESPETMEAYHAQGKDSYFYCVYNVKESEIETVVVGSRATFELNTIVKNDNDYTGRKTANGWGRVCRGTAKKGEICPVIMVYVGNPSVDTIDHAPIQTAPFYDGDKVGGGDSASSNPYGPAQGSANVGS